MLGEIQEPMATGALNQDARLALHDVIATSIPQATGTIAFDGTG
jgi:hypothetical protein